MEAALFANLSSNGESDFESDVLFANDSSNESSNESNLEPPRIESLPDRLTVLDLSVPPACDHFVDNVCSKSCKNGCSLVIANLTKEEKIATKKSFKASTKTRRKNILLEKLKSQKALGVSTDGFRLNHQMFCNSSFSSLTGVSLYIIKKVLADYSHGYSEYTHGQSNSGRDTLKQAHFVGWVLSFLELYGQADPVNVTTVLPAFLRRGELFKIYSNEAPEPHLKKSSFYHLFKERFGVQRVDKSLPNVRISKYSTHSRCDVCHGIDQFRRTSRTENELNYAESLKLKHREQYSQSRAIVNKRKQLAITFPSDHVHVAIDGMDNSKSMIPRLLEKTKKLAMWKLPSKISGVIITSAKYPKKRKILLEVNHDQFKQGSNMIVSIIYKVILDFFNEHKVLPKVLDLNLDNCARENKNRYVFSFLAALVKLDVFTEVQVNFLQVGHTGNSVDQIFSILTQEFKTEIKSLDELLEKMRSAPIEPKPVVESLLYIWDWKSFCEQHLSEKELKYHSYYHSFQVIKEDEVVKFRAKHLPQDTNWTPATGINLFKQEDIIFVPLPAAEFRIQSLNIPKIYKDLQKFLIRLPMDLRVKLTLNWDALRDSLESLPGKRLNLPKMKIEDLPKQTKEVEPELPEEYCYIEDPDIPDLEGDIIIEEVKEAIFEEEVTVNMDVACYTKSKRGRPWVGRVMEILPGKKFRINWFSRKGRRDLNSFYAMEVNSEPLISIEDYESVILWGFSELKTQESFRISSYWLSALKHEYEMQDRNLLSEDI